MSFILFSIITSQFFWLSNHVDNLSMLIISIGSLGQCYFKNWSFRPLGIGSKLVLASLLINLLIAQSHTLFFHISHNHHFLRTVSAKLRIDYSALLVYVQNRRNMISLQVSILPKHVQCLLIPAITINSLEKVYFQKRPFSVLIRTQNRLSFVQQHHKIILYCPKAYTVFPISNPFPFCN